MKVLGKSTSLEDFFHGRENDSFNQGVYDLVSSIPDLYLFCHKSSYLPRSPSRKKYSFEETILELYYKIILLAN